MKDSTYTRPEVERILSEALESGWHVMRYQDGQYSPTLDPTDAETDYWIRFTPVGADERGVGKYSIGIEQQLYADPIPFDVARTLMSETDGLISRVKASLGTDV